MQLRFNALFACTGTLLCASVTLALAIPTRPNLIVFGNSLSDVGNTAALTNTPAYWEGRFTNSYVWNEYTARILGMKLQNKAFGGATSNNILSPGSIGNTTIPSFRDQVTTWLQAKPAPTSFNLKNDIIEIEIGGNDVLNRLEGLLTGTVNVADFANQMAASIAADTQRLFAAGYKKVHLWNLPPMDQSPIVISLGAGPLVKPIVAAINNAVKAAVQSQGVRILDLNDLTLVALQPNVLSAMGITVTTGACFVTDAAGAITICNNPDQHLFYDMIHPSSRMHYLWGTAAALLALKPDSTLTTSEALTLIGVFNIGESNREDNIIADWPF
ncbi:hypothetical protein GGF42_005362 [Coemansia sp. RSA 2424]|nr:hypothetical protein GGF42_005362 [Coemansia sp. RSA 2424]